MLLYLLTWFLFNQNAIIQNELSPSPHLQKLVQAYPDFIKSATDNTITWKDGTVMQFDDDIKNKKFEQLLNSPDLEDMFAFDYPKTKDYLPIARNQDAGRIRKEDFFLKMYGKTKQEVQSKLTTIVWLPKTLKTTLQVTTVNNVHKKLEAISAELDQKPHLLTYLTDVGGTFNWRNIAGTTRMSAHSFGTTIDINVKYSNYWRWAAKNPTEDSPMIIEYKNRIPYEIVAIFEKHGFIWGGKWYHYDTMHFEYRPELLL